MPATEASEGPGDASAAIADPESSASEDLGNVLATNAGGKVSGL